MMAIEYGKAVVSAAEGAAGGAAAKMAALPAAARPADHGKAVVSTAEGAAGGAAAKMAALPGEAPKVANGLPKITNQAEFEAFFKGLSIDSQYGTVKEAGTAPDARGDEKKVFIYKGLVFRCASRSPDDPSLANGFKSKNDLSVHRNRTEAMGLGIGIDDGNGGTKYTCWGISGRAAFRPPRA